MTLPKLVHIIAARKGRTLGISPEKFLSLLPAEQAVDLVATELASVVPALLHYENGWRIVVQKRGNHPDEQGGEIKSTAAR